MEISKLIQQLTTIKEMYGDLPIGDGEEQSAVNIRIVGRSGRDVGFGDFSEKPEMVYLKIW